MTVGNLRNKFQISDQPFAQGGEGTVHDVVGHPNLVAKLYHPAGRTAQREAKLKAMLASPPGDAAHSQIAWPREILYSTGGKFLGFMMPRVRNFSKIDSLYSHDSRDRYNWSWYIQVAQNLCAAVNSVHKSGHVIGDLNPANICVDPTTSLVTLVDTDSYSVRAGDSVYPCTVCREEYIPPEILRILDSGSDLKKVNTTTFTVYTDLFALGLHIFALLMNGCHPYSCSAKSEALEQRYNLLSNVRSGYFPFDGKVNGVTVPRYAPPISILPPLLRQVCVRTFADGSRYPKNRVSAAEWYDALQELEDSLVQCPSHKHHQYWSGLTACPWCANAATMKRLLATQQKAMTVTQTRAATPQKAAPPAPVLVSHSTTRPTSFLGRIFRGVGGFFGGVAGAAAWVAGFLGSGLGTVSKVLLALGSFLGWNILGNWLLYQVPISSWWWGLLRYAAFGIIPFMPLWLFAILAAFGFDYAEDVANILAKTTRWATLLLYGGVTIYFGLDHGMVNTVFWTVLACLPSVAMCRWFPGITWDMSW